MLYFVQLEGEVFLRIFLSEGKFIIFFCAFQSTNNIMPGMLIHHYTLLVNLRVYQYYNDVCEMVKKRVTKFIDRLMDFWFETCQ